MQKLVVTVGNPDMQWLQTEAETQDISVGELVRRAIDVYRKLQYTCSAPAYRDDVIADDDIIQVMSPGPPCPPRLLTEEEQRALAERAAVERKICTRKRIKSTE